MTPLEKFGRWCLTEMSGDGGHDIACEAAQDKAIELGLIGYVDVAEPCGDECHCAEYHGQFPAECLRETPLANGESRHGKN